MEKKIKVAFMSHLLDRRPGKGTEVYLRHLVKEFLKDPEIELTLIHFEPIPEEPLYKEAREIIMNPAHRNAMCEMNPAHRNAMCEMNPAHRNAMCGMKPFGGFRFLAELYFFLTTKERFDIIHWFVPRLYPFYWLAPAQKIVVTSHGAADKIAPNFKTFALRIFNFIFTYFHFWVDAVIGVSESGRKEIIKAYHFDPQKVHAIYNGVSDVFRPIDKTKALELIKKKYGILSPPFILYAGRLEPRKNVKRIVEAYDLFRQTSSREEKLIIVGGPGSASREVKQRAAVSPFSKDIQFIDVVYFEDMPSLYSLAEIFIFPSVSESFGLPVIEAMACGTPVITSDITSLPEIAGDGALKINPYSAEEMAQGMRNLLENDLLKKEYIRKGFENIKRFSWTKMAREIKELYEKLLGYSRAQKMPEECGICDKRSVLEFKESLEVFTLWECSLCRVQFWYPLKNPGGEWYESDPCLTYRNVVKRTSIDANHREFLKEDIAPGRLLDVGMGTGNFMLAAQKKGYDVWGIDFNKESVKVARNDFGLKNSYPETLGAFIGWYKGPPFGAVTCFEIIEHLDNPGEFLENVKTILAPNGYLGLSVPNRDSHHLFKDMDHPPKHLTRWDEKSMRNFLENHNFQIVRIKKLRPAFSYFIMKFHRWTQGFLSFGLVAKLAPVSATPAGPEAKKRLMTKIGLLRRLAQIKDWLIFILPAAILYFYLFFRRRHYVGLYVLARTRK